jgi:hypothetical protein
MQHYITIVNTQTLRFLRRWAVTDLEADALEGAGNVCLDFS